MNKKKKQVNLTAEIEVTPSELKSILYFLKGKRRPPEKKVKR